MPPEILYCKRCGEAKEFYPQLVIGGGEQLIGPICRVQISREIDLVRCEPLRQVAKIDLSQGRKRFTSARKRR